MTNENTNPKPAPAEQDSAKGLDGAPCSPSSLTPETDQFWRTYRVPYTHAAADFARKLESERNEARKAAETAKAYKRVMKSANQNLKRERDEARDQLYRIARDGFGMEDTIGGEACVDYVLRRLGKSLENAIDEAGNPAPEKPESKNEQKAG